MRRYLALALACVLAAISVSALAMGLGEVRLNSYLNQRLDAEIELVSAAADELESLKVGLADREAFERYGLSRSAVLSSLQFRVVRRPNGTAYVKVTSTEPVREPFLTFLIEADWSRGRVLREYTVLLDPPTFASREQQSEPAEAQSPVVTPAPAERERAPVQADARGPEPRVDEQPRAAETEVQTGDVIDIPSLDEEPAPRSIPGPAVTPDMGETYGPIQRNETLWGIAQRLRPAESVTINQVMVALYRANPEAFQGNINRLKAGYILRIPEFSDITGISRTEAFRDVKRQNEAWRAGSRPAPAPAAPSDVAPVVEPEPELSLVAPEEDVTADAGMGADESAEDAIGGDAMAAGDEVADADTAAGDAAVDLGPDTESADRLLDVEDESMQALQEQDDMLASGDSVEPPPLPAEETPSETDVTALEESGAADEAVTPEEVPAEEAVAEDVPARSAPVIAPVRAEPGLVEKLTNLMFSTLGLGLAAVILVLVLVGFLLIRRRRDAVKAKAAAAYAEWEQDSDASLDGDDAAMLAGDDGEADVDGVFAHGAEHEDNGTTSLEDDTEATQLLDNAANAELGDAETPATSPENADGDDFADTVFGGQAVTLDDNDPLSEADFHMAYGLYDQAAEVVEKAVERDPSRKDYLAKLAEIHFAANNTNGFLDAAGKLKALAGTDDSGWENVAIMGRQIAPENEMFGEAGTASSVDLDFGSADEEFSGEETATAEAVPDSTPAAAVDDSLDFDVELETSATATESTETEAVADAGAAPAAGDVATDEADTGASSDDGLDFDLDVGATEETAASEEVDHAADEQDSADSSDFDFDLDDLGEPEDDGDTADASSELDGLSDEDSQAPDAESDGYSDDDTQTEFDKALEELSAFVDTNIPETDAGDAVSAEGDDSGLSLDDYSFDQDDAADGSADDYNIEGTGEEEEDIGEIGTKIDLARAYIDMGDPDGARSILEEVVADGDDEQQKEARELLDQLA